MHIADGVLATQVWVGGYVATGGITAFCLRRITPEQIPKISIMTAAFFVASLIHVPIGPTSVHLILNGLCGVILGWGAYLSILVGLTLQALLFQHGGLTTIGVNTFNMGVGALAAFGFFKLRGKIPIGHRDFLFGFLAGVIGVAVGLVSLSICLLTSGEEFLAVVKLAIVAHLPVMAIEGLIAGFAIIFLLKVKPEVLK